MAPTIEQLRAYAAGGEGKPRGGEGNPRGGSTRRPARAPSSSSGHNGIIHRGNVGYKPPARKKKKETTKEASTKSAPKGDVDKYGFKISGSSSKPAERLDATPKDLKDKLKHLGDVDPQFKELGKDILRGSTPFVQKVFNALDVGRKPIQNFVFGATTEEMAKDPTAGHAIWKDQRGKNKGKNLFYDTPDKSIIDNVNRFVADVITSPISFLSGGVAGIGRGALKQSLGKHVVRHGVEKGLTKKAATDLANELTGKVVKRSGQEVSATVGTIRKRIASHPTTKDIQFPKELRGGIAAANPFVGTHAARAKGRFLPGVKAHGGVSLIPGSVTSKVTGPVGQAIAGNPFTQALLGHTAGRKAALGGYSSIMAATTARTTDQLRRNFVGEGSGVLTDVVKAFGRNRKGEAAFDAVLTGKALAINAKQEKAVENFKTFFWEGMQAKKAAAGLKDGILDNYTPLLVGKAAREAAGKNVPPIFNNPTSKAHARILAKGMGDTAAEVNVELRKAALSGELPDLAEFFQKNDEFFSESSYKNWQQYLDQQGKRIYGKQYADFLENEGLSPLSMAETKSGLDVGILRQAGFGSPDDALELARTGAWGNKALVKLKELDPDQFARLKTTANLKVAEANLSTQKAALKTKLGPAQAKGWNDVDIFTDPAKSPLTKQRWAIISAETADMLLPQKEAAYAELLNDLRKAGHSPIEAVGVWRGASEKSFVVPSMPAKQALEFGRRYGQDAVFTNLGALNADGTVNTIRALKFGEEVTGDYTEMLIGGSPVRFGFDTNQKAFPLDSIPSGKHVSGGLNRTMESLQKAEKALADASHSKVGQARFLVEGADGKRITLTNDKASADSYLAALAKNGISADIRKVTGVSAAQKHQLAKRVDELKGKLDKGTENMSNYAQGLTEKGSPWPITKDDLKSGIIPREFKKDYGVVTGTIFAGLNGKPIPKHLAQELQENFANAYQMGDFVRGAQKVINIWKQSVTGVFPGFHVRNAMGGWFNNYIGGVRFYQLKQFEEMLTGKHAGRVWKEYGGLSTERLLEEMVASGFAFAPKSAVRRGGQANIVTEFGLETPTREAMYGPIRAAADKVGGGLQTMARTPAMVIEDGLRGSAFLRGMEKFGDVDLARDFTFYRHGDYNHMSVDERKLRTFLPFYRWMRTNIPFQIQSMVEAPGKYQKYARFVENFSGKAPEDEDSMYKMPVNDMVQERGGFRLPWDPKRIIMPDLPFTDLNDINPRELLGRTTFGSIIGGATKTNLLTGAPTRFISPGPLQKVQVLPLKKFFPDKFRVSAGGELQVDQSLIAYMNNILNPTSRLTSTFDPPTSKAGKEAAEKDRLGRWLHKGLGIPTQKTNPTMSRNIANSKLDRVFREEIYPLGYAEKSREMNPKKGKVDKYGFAIAPD